MVRSEGVGTESAFGVNQLGTTVSGELKMAGHFLFSRLTEENVARANGKTIAGMRGILGHLLAQNSTQGRAPEARWLLDIGHSPVNSLSDLAVVADAVNGRTVGDDVIDIALSVLPAVTNNAEK